MKNLSVAYSIKRKTAKKKMAEGGSVRDEKRPMPEDKHDDAKMVSQNSKAKPVASDWSDKSAKEQSQAKGGIQPKKHPKMVEGVISARLRDQEGRLIQEMPPASPKEQPSKMLDEKDAKKKGPDALALHMKKMADGGKINEAVSQKRAEEDEIEHPAHLEADDDQMAPDKDDYMSDQETMLLAEGGRAGGEEDSYDDDGKEDSIAAAIMAKRDRLHAMIDSGAMDEDHAAKHMMAEGGQVDLSLNADEEPNNEDQMSYEALKKENYSESEGLDQLDEPRDSNLHGDSREDSEEDKHDRVSAIRSRMKSRKQF